MNIKKLMKQAQDMQQKMTEQLSALEVTASSGGDMVTVKMNGAKEFLSIKIDPEVVKPEDTEMLEDLILAAVKEASRKVDELIADQLGGLLPPGVKLPGL
jgi:DNA-binding YbaB/EbfC family protein